MAAPHRMNASVMLNRLVALIQNATTRPETVPATLHREPMTPAIAVVPSWASLTM